MSERHTSREGSPGRGGVLTASLAAALVLTSLVCALAFAESASRTTASKAPPPASPPPAPPPPSAGPAGEGVASGEDAGGHEETAPENSAEPETQLVAKDFMVASDETVEGDRYFVGNNTDVEGTIDGDFFTFSKGVSVPGHVTGDVNSFGSNVSISGAVDDDARLFAGEILVRGKVGGDLIAFSGEIDVAKGAKVGGRTLAFAGTLTLDGEFKQAMNIGGGEVNFGGHALRDVKVESDALTFTDDARIDGNLTYTAREEISSLSGERAKRLVGGKITFVPKKTEEKKSSALSSLVWTVWTFVATFLIGCLLILIAHRLVRTILVTARAETLKSFGFGILGHILVPFVGLILVCVCLGLGLVTCITSAGKIPALPFAFLPPGLLVLALWAVLFYLAKFVVSAALGDTILRRLGRDPSPYAALFVGMIPLWILLSIPVLGSFLYFIVVPVLGIGAILVGLRAHFVKESAPEVQRPTIVSNVV